MSVEELFSAIARAVLAVLAAMSTQFCNAGSIYVSTMPKVIYYAILETTSASGYQSPRFDTAELAFRSGKAYFDHCEPRSDGYSDCYTAENLTPYVDSGMINNLYQHYSSSIKICTTSPPPTCQGPDAPTYYGPVDVYMTFQCPIQAIGYDNGFPVYYGSTSLSGSDSNNPQVVCVAILSDTESCLDCLGLGDPVHPGTGESFEVESDYRNPAGTLELLRTYRSTNGSFSWIAGEILIDNSANGLAPLACQDGTYGSNSSGVYYSYCFPYISYLPSGALQTYRLLRSDGRQLVFSGPPGTISSRPDINVAVAKKRNAAGATEWWVKDADKGWEIYDANGKLQRRVSYNGIRNVSYSPGSMRDSFGRQASYSNDTFGHLTSFTDPDGGVYVFGYDSSVNLIGVTYPDNTSRSYLYEPAHVNDGGACFNPNGTLVRSPSLLTGIVDENGNRISTTDYDCTGRAVASRRSGTIDQYSFSYGTSTGVVDPLGTSRTYLFSNVLSVMRPTGVQEPVSGGGTAATSVAYDANGNAASRDDFVGNRTCYLSDLGRNVELARVEGLSNSSACSSYTVANAALPAGSRKTTSQWHSDWRIKAAQAEPGKLTTWVYNGQPDPFNGGAIASCAPGTALLPDGRPIAVLCKQIEQATTDADGRLGFGATPLAGASNRVRQWTYNQFGQVLTAKGPRTDVNDNVTYAYYADTTTSHALGDLSQVTNAAGQVKQYVSYNKSGQLLRSIDANGIVTDNTYDLRHRLTSTTVGGLMSTYAYDAAGQLHQLTLPDTTVITYAYDLAHRLTGVTDQTGNSITYTLDNAGNRTQDQIKDPRGTLARAVTRTFDALGRVQQVTGATQ